MSAKKVSKRDAEILYKLRKLDIVDRTIRMLGYIALTAIASVAVVHVADAFAGQDTRLTISMQIALGAAGALGVTAVIEFRIASTRKKKIQRLRARVDSLEKAQLPKAKPSDQEGPEDER